MNYMREIVFVFLQYLITGSLFCYLIKSYRKETSFSLMWLVMAISGIVAILFPTLNLVSTLLYWLSLGILGSIITENISLSICFVSILGSVSIVSDYFVTVFLAFFLKQYSEIWMLFLHIFLSGIIDSLLTIFFNIIVSKFIDLNKISSSFLNLAATLTFFNCMTMYLIIAYERILGETNRLEQINFGFFLIYTIILTCSLLLFFASMKRKMQDQIQQIQLKDLNNYVNQIELDYQDLRKFRHDYQNILLSIEGYINEKDIEGLEKYYRKYIRKTQEELNKNLFSLTDLSNLKDPIPKSIIASKLTTAQSQNIETFFEEKDIITQFNIDPILFARILGILLDNALEASVKAKKKILRVAIIKNKSYSIIVIGNSYSGKLPPLYRMMEKGYSTKGQNRGLGLFNVKSLVQGLPNVTLETEIKKEMFVQVLRIKEV